MLPCAAIEPVEGIVVWLMLPLVRVRVPATVRVSLLAMVNVSVPLTPKVTLSRVWEPVIVLVVTNTTVLSLVVASRVPAVYVQSLVVRMMEARVSVPPDLSISISGREPALVLPPPVNVWFAEPVISIRPVPPSKVEACVMWPWAATEPAAGMVVWLIEPSVRVSVPTRVRVWELAMVLATALVNEMLLNVAVDGVRVAAEVSNTTVPELCVNVGEPEMVKVLLTCRLPLVLVNVPPERAKVPLMSMVPLPPAKVPSAWE